MSPQQVSVDERSIEESLSAQSVGVPVRERHQDLLRC
jgi:hypothetical protein